MALRPEPPRVRLAELVAALSLGVDLGFGQPMEHVLRQCLIALRLADRAGLDDQERATVYYTALLINVGCHTDAHEQAKWFGDDIALKSSKYDYDPKSLASAAAMLRRVGAGTPPLHRIRTGLELAFGGYHEVDGMIAEHARMAQALATELGLPPAVGAALAGSYEQWDGKGWPGLLAADEIPLASRIAQFAEYMEVADRVAGPEAAAAVAIRRSGSQFDPSIVELLATDANDLLKGLDEVAAWDAVIAAEPALTVVLTPDEFDAALLAVANFVDLKSPFTLGHSRAVAELVAAAAQQSGWPAHDVRQVYRAGLVHDFGRLGVSNAIWDKPTVLGIGEWERVRMHPYLAERMLRQSPSLEPLGRIAVQQAERLDGSGYPRGLPGSAITPEARLLAAADAYQARREPRPYRPARPAGDAADELRQEVRAGRLDATAVDAVLGAAGHVVRRRREGPAGLTAREVQVLTVLARGRSAKQIADELVISPKTASNHIQHIYTKIGATNRATASLFAVQHGLLPTQHYGAPEAI
jgi:HD-GYP domain-containing protein (c-di-GMP phosphodiesterase class II)